MKVKTFFHVDFGSLTNDFVRRHDSVKHLIDGITTSPSLSVLMKRSAETSPVHLSVLFWKTRIFFLREAVDTFVLGFVLFFLFKVKIQNQ